MNKQQHTNKNRPGVGIGVIVISKHYPNSVVIGRRKGNLTGSGLYALPGGHLEFGESWEDCAIREVLEETGLKITNVTYETVVNAVDLQNDYHYITLFMKGEVDYDFKTEPENLEPDKCEGWEWTNWNNIPEDDKLFCALKVVRRQNYNPFNK